MISQRQKVKKLFHSVMEPKQTLRKNNLLNQLDIKYFQLLILKLYKENQAQPLASADQYLLM